MQDYSHKQLASALVLAADFSTADAASKAVVDLIAPNLSEHEAERLRHDLASVIELVRESK